MSRSQSLQTPQELSDGVILADIGSDFTEISIFKEETLNIIDQTPNRLLEIEGIGPKRIEMIRKNWNDQKIIREVIIFLRKYLISTTFAQKIYKTYGYSCIEKVKENPYVLAKDIVGIGFKIADNIAKKLGFENDHPLRIASGIEYVLYELTNAGHTCYPEEDFLIISQKILQVDENLIKNQLDKLVLTNQIIKNPLELDGEKINFI